MYRLLPLLLLIGCAHTGSTYGVDSRPSVTWQSEHHKEWEDAPRQAYLVSVSFSETMGLDFVYDFKLTVKDFYDPTPENHKDDVYGLYRGYNHPGVIEIFLRSPRQGFYETGLCHELLHMHEHIGLGVSYLRARPNFTDSTGKRHFTIFNKEESEAIIEECKTRAWLKIMDAPPPQGCKELPWTLRDRC